MDSGRRLHRWLSWIAAGSVAFVLFAAYLATLAPGLTWANYGVDGGDLVAAAVTLGVAHPTGYPTYTLLLHAFLAVLSIGEPAYEAALFSALATALAGGALTLLLTRALPQEPWGRGLIATAVGLGLGLSRLVWSQAVIAEVYGLHFLFLVLGLWLAWRLGDTARRVGAPDFVLMTLMGLGMGNHVTLGLMLPVWGALVVIRWRKKDLGLPAALRLASAFLLGLAVYVYLPLRASAYPPVNWGVPNTWNGFQWTVAAEPYRALAFGLPPEALPDRVSAWSSLLLEGFGVMGVLFGLMGLVMGRSTSKSLDRAALWMLVVYSVFAIGYNTADSADYLIAAHLGFAWFVAHGLLLAAGEVASRLRLPGKRASTLVLLLFAGGLAWGLRSVWKQVDASRDTRAADYGRQAMDQAPPGAVLLAWEATDAFPLWYHQYALGMRPDVSILVVPLMQFDWYYDVVASTYPRLALPRELFTEEAVRSGAVLLALSDRPRCQAVQEGQADGLRLRLLCSSAFPEGPG